MTLKFFVNVWIKHTQNPFTWVALIGLNILGGGAVLENIAGGVSNVSCVLSTIASPLDAVVDGRNCTRKHLSIPTPILTSVITTTHKKKARVFFNTWKSANDLNLYAVCILPTTCTSASSSCGILRFLRIFRSSAGLL